MKIKETSKLTSKIIYFGENLDFDEISNILGVKPTLTKRKGDDYLGKVKVKQDYWKFQCEENNSIALSDHINQILKSIKLSKDLNLLNQKLEVYLGIKILLGKRIPDMNIDTKTLATLSRYNFHLDIDMYYSEI